MAALTDYFEPAQIELFRDLAEAYLGVDREKRNSFMVFRGQGRVVIQGNGLSREEPRAAYDDIRELGRFGFLGVEDTGSSLSVTVPADGRRAYTELMESAAEATNEIEEHVWRYFDAPEFQHAFPATYAKWRDAVGYVWSSESERDFSTIGHISREAIQEFVTELISKYSVQGASQDISKTRDRFSTVVNARRAVIGDRKSEALDALYGYWEAVGNLAQRQEHAGQRQGSEDLTWEDGRRLVFQLGFVMFEAARTLKG